MIKMTVGQFMNLFDHVEKIMTEAQAPTQEPECRYDDLPPLKSGTAEYAPVWRDFWQTEIEVAPGSWKKLISVTMAALHAGSVGYGNLAGEPTCIAHDAGRGVLVVFPTPNRDYHARIPEYSAPREARAGRYARGLGVER